MTLEPSFGFAAFRGQIAGQNMGLTSSDTEDKQI